MNLRHCYSDAAAAATAAAAADADIEEKFKL